MIIFALPAYNEEENIGPLLDKIRSSMEGASLEYRVVVVDDGSTDATGEIVAKQARSLPIEVVRHEHNLGLPATLRDALKSAVRGAKPDDVIITMDADNTHEPALAVDMVHLLARKGCDVVIASRYERGGREVGLSLSRRILSGGVNVLLKVFFPIRGVRDYTCGYRAFRADALKKALDTYGDRLIEATTFCATAEVLLKMSSLGIKAAEVPLVLRYDQKRGSSKMKVVRTILDYLGMIARLRPWVTPVALFALVLGLFLIGVNLPLTDGDTAYYGKIARNILDTGDWVTLRFKGDAMVDKPPLTMWLMALSFKLFGVSNRSVRLWHTLMGAGLVVITYLIARRFYSRRVAFWSGLILATSVQFFYQQMVPQQDLPVLFFQALAFYLFIRFAEDRDFVSYYLMWVSIGLAVLTRGLIGVLFPVAVLGAYLILRKFLVRAAGDPVSGRGVARRELAWVGHLMGGGLLFLAVAAPWFVVEYLKLGFPFIDMFFGSGNARFYATPGADGGILRFLSYIPLILLGFIPWSVFLPQALGRAWVGLHDGVQEGGLRVRGDLFLLVWAAVGFFVPFLIKWRVIRYLLPCFPPLAILAARFIMGHVRLRSEQVGIRLAGWLSLILLLPVLALTVMFLARQFPDELVGYLPLVLPFLVVLVTCLGGFSILALAGRARAAFYVMVLGTVLSYVTLVASVGRGIEDILPWETLAHSANQQAGANTEVVAVGEAGNVFLDFYVERPVKNVTDPEELVRRLRARHDLVFFITERDLEGLQERNPDLPIQVIRRAGGVAVGSAIIYPVEMTWFRPLVLAIYYQDRQ